MFATTAKIGQIDNGLVHSRVRVGGYVDENEGRDRGGARVEPVMPLDSLAVMSRHADTVAVTMAVLSVMYACGYLVAAAFVYLANSMDSGAVMSTVVQFMAQVTSEVFFRFSDVVGVFASGLSWVAAVMFVPYQVVAAQFVGIAGARMYWSKMKHPVLGVVKPDWRRAMIAVVIEWLTCALFQGYVWFGPVYTALVLVVHLQVFLLLSEFDRDVIELYGGLSFLMVLMSPSTRAVVTALYVRRAYIDCGGLATEVCVMPASADSGWLKLSSVFRIDFSSAASVIGTADLSAIGTVAAGAKASAKIRALALTGDRAASLMLARRAYKRGWTVQESSDIAQVLFTNAAFTKYFDAKLTRVFPDMVHRSEKRKGTLVEAILGVAVEAGDSDQSRIEQFLFEQLVEVVGINLPGSGFGDRLSDSSSGTNSN